jgi:Flp pilus assembly protein TadD/DNA repair exonuclease SbcCD ATPase subunit
MMRRLLPLLVFAGSLFQLIAADSSEQFLSAYQSYQQAERSERDGNTADALKKYRYAESLLGEIVAKDPSWQKAVVEYRLKKTRDGVMRLQGSSDTSSGQGVQADNDLPATEPANGVNPGRQGPSITIVAPGASSQSQARQGYDSSAEARRLKKEVEKLQAELLTAKEALSTEKGRSKDLDKAKWVEERSMLEKDLLAAKDRISTLSDKLHARDSWEKDLKNIQKKLDDAVADKLAIEEMATQRDKSTAETSARLVGELSEANRKVAEAAEVRQKFEALSGDVQKDRESLKQLQAKLEQAQLAAKESSEKNDDLQKQLVQITGKLAASAKQSAEVEPLRAQIKGLQAELATSKTAVAKAAAESEESRRGSRKASEKLLTQLNSAEADRLVLEEERRRLEAKLEDASKVIGGLEKQGGSVDTLAKQIDDLKKQLGENSKVLEQSKAKASEVAATAEKEKADWKQREVAALSVKAQLEEQNASLQNQLKNALDRMTGIGVMSPDAAFMQEQIKKLQEQADSNAKNYDEARRKLAEANASRPDQEKALKDKEKALADAKSEAEKLRSDLAASNEKITSLGQQSARQEDRLKQLQDQLAELSKAGAAKANGTASSGESAPDLEELRHRLADKDEELARLRKLKGKTTAGGEKTLEENSVLRGIVMRQVREEAKKAQARRLMEEEMKRLNIQSQSLSENIALLTAPSLSLTPQERALFKDAQLVVTEETGKLQASVAAPIPHKEGEGQVNGSGTVTEVVTVSEASKSPEPTVPPNAKEEQVSVPPVSATNNPPPQDTVSQGKFKESLAHAKEAFDKQDYAQAENSFKEALKLSPDDYFTLANLGVVEFQLGKMKEAEEVLLKASQKPSQSSFALTTLGIVHYRQERLADAEKVLRKAITINDQDFTAHNYLGIVLAASGNGKAGESEIMKSLEINKDYADAHFNLAVIYATGKPPSKMMARKHYTRAVELGAPPDKSLEQLIQ